MKTWFSKRLFFIAAVVMIGTILSGCAGQAQTTTPAADDYANSELLAGTEWLAQHLNDANVRIVDVRKASDYSGGHIEGSVNIDTMDFKGPMYDQSSSVKWTVLPKEQFEKLMGDAGIGNDTIVVAVDDAKMLWASRLFWTLEYYGHGDGKARVLNGGLGAWKAESRGLTDEVPTVKPVTFVASPQPAKLATKQQVLDTLDKKDAFILATIPLAEFQGGNSKNAARGGHIPGAAQLDWTENLAGDPAVFKPAEDLSKMYADLGFTRSRSGVVY